MNATYNPTRPVLRTVFVAIALVVTLSLGAAIEGLAQHYAADAVPAATTMLASAR